MADPAYTSTDGFVQSLSNRVRELLGQDPIPIPSNNNNSFDSWFTEAKNYIDGLLVSVGAENEKTVLSIQPKLRLLVTSLQNKLVLLENLIQPKQVLHVISLQNKLQSIVSLMHLKLH